MKSMNSGSCEVARSAAVRSRRRYCMCMLPYYLYIDFKKYGKEGDVLMA